jgi:signal recognition particle receptor subunit beta
MVPVVFQLNKRDIPGVVAVSELRELFRARRGVYVATSARNGDGIDQVITTAVQLATQYPQHG